MAIENLKNEGIICGSGKFTPDNKLVCKTGDIMYDVSLYYRKKTVKIEAPDDFILLTIHRAANTDNIDRLQSIVTAINALSEINFIFPMHPRTRKILEYKKLSFGNHIKVIEPVGYLEMLQYEEKCSAILTDSGGVQKEAFFFKKPCITMRNSTEWVELVDSGWNTLTGPNTENIISAVENITVPDIYPNFYGDGNAAEKIIDDLIRTY